MTRYLTGDGNDSMTTKEGHVCERQGQEPRVWRTFGKVENGSMITRKGYLQWPTQGQDNNQSYDALLKTYWLKQLDDIKGRRTSVKWFLTFQDLSLLMERWEKPANTPLACHMSGCTDLKQLWPRQMLWRLTGHTPALSSQWWNQQHNNLKYDALLICP